MCTLLLFPFCAALCSSSISHITLTLVSPQSSPRSFITVSLKRWLGSLECHGNAVPQCVYTHSCICIFWCVCVWVCLDPCVWAHSCMHFSILGVLLFFSFLLRRRRRYEGVSLQWQREEETVQVDREQWGEFRRSSEAATGRGQRGWQCLLVAALSTRLSLNPALGQRRVTQYARRLLKGSYTDSLSCMERNRHSQASSELTPWRFNTMKLWKSNVLLADISRELLTSSFAAA